MAEPAESQQDRLQRAREALDEATRVAASNAAQRRSGAPEEPAQPRESEPHPPPGRRELSRSRDRRRTLTQEAPITDGPEDAEAVARAVALNQLNHSARSRAQLAEAMARKDVPEAVAEKVLDRFEEVGLIDDVEYAAMLVRTRQTERGLARRALAVELKRKGIVGEAATEALDAVEPEDEEAAARRVVEKRLRSMSSLEPEVKKRRLAAMLARKGHAAGLSYRVIDEALRAE